MVSESRKRGIRRQEEREEKKESEVNVFSHVILPDLLLHIRCNLIYEHQNTNTRCTRMEFPLRLKLIPDHTFLS